MAGLSALTGSPAIAIALHVPGTCGTTIAADGGTTARRRSYRRMMTGQHDEFPGRWVTGVCLIAGPLLVLAGMALRLPFHFFFPQQLAAFAAHPRRLGAGYECIAAGTILLGPAIAGLAGRIGRTHPTWATAGGVLVLLGLFARTFHAGADHFALSLVPARGADAATGMVADFYNRTTILMTLTPAILSGWVVLALAAWLSGRLGAWRAAALALMSGLMIGVLKGSSAMSLIATGGLCVALVPEGLIVLSEGPSPGARSIAGWSMAVALAGVVFFVLGRLG